MSVWENTVDGGKYWCGVEDIPGGDGYSGTLIVKEGDLVIHQEPVGIAYAARFGPDMDDVRTWSERAIDVIDHPEKRS